MKRIELYVCEVCSTQYKSKDEADRCEKSHYTPQKIIHCRYLPFNEVEKGYPVRIDVQFEDGAVLRYRR